MRVLIVSQYFWPETFRISDLARELVSRGHEVVVLTGYPTYPRRSSYETRRPAEDEWCGVRIVRVPLADRGAGRHWQIAANYLSYAASASLAGPFRLGWWRPDVVLAFQLSPVTSLIPALILGRVHCSPVAAWVQDLWPESVAAVGAVRSRRVLTVATSAVDLLYRRCDLILAHSEDFVPTLRERGVRPQRLGYLPAWAEDHYQPTTPDPSLARALRIPTGFVVMTAGNLGVAQSLETLVGAAERLRSDPTIHWVVVGDGKQREWLAAEVIRRGLEENVHLLGRHPVQLMPQLFAHADLLVATLRRDPVLAMTLPARVQSYLACGRPVAAAMDGQGARVVREAGGIAVPAQDTAGLANAVATVKAMAPARRRQLGEAARQHYLTHFERSVLLDRFEAHLVRTVETTSAAPRPPNAVNPDADRYRLAWPGRISRSQSFPLHR